MTDPSDTPGPPAEPSPPLPIAVLASGSGTNLQALLDTVHGREAQIVAVASNLAAAPALERARARGVATAVFPRAEHPDRAARDLAMADWLAQRGARLVVLAGYMELISEPFLARFPGAVINVHPSLLPAFPGLRAVEQALAYGVKVFGVTVHLVDAGVDSGPVILQSARELPDARTPEEVMAELRPLEHKLLPQAVRLFARGPLRLDPENPRRVRIPPRDEGAASGKEGAIASDEASTSVGGEASPSASGNASAGRGTGKSAIASGETSAGCSGSGESTIAGAG